MYHQMFSYSNKPQSLMQVFKDAFRFYKTTFRQIIVWSLLLFLVISIFSYGLSLLYPEDKKGEIMEVLLIFIPIVTMLGFMIIYLYGECFLLYRMHGLVNNFDVAPTTCFLMATKNVLKVLVPFIISFLFLFAIVFFGQWSSLIVLNFTNQKLQLGHIFLALTIPMIIALTIIGLYYLLFMPWIVSLKIIVDRGRIYKSIKEAFSLLEGSWWQTFFAIFLVIICMGFLNQLVTLLIAQFSKNMWVMLVPMMIVYALITPYLNAVLLLQFNNLKQKMLIRNLPKSDAV
jgi:hypothetical protein